jgi:uncharacterized membrane protein YraQ (UPF0718 family)
LRPFSSFSVYIVEIRYYGVNEMDFVINLFLKTAVQVWTTFLHNWPFLLASILIAVALKLFLDPNKVSAFLIRYRRAGVLGATAAAVATPLCSCGTTAILLGMMAGMMPWAPIVAFMVASPLTSPQELVYSAGLFGWPFAWAFYISSIVLGLLGGLAAGLMENRGWLANQARLAAPAPARRSQPTSLALNLSGPAMAACACGTTSLELAMPVPATCGCGSPVAVSTPAVSTSAGCGCGSAVVEPTSLSSCCGSRVDESAPAACGCGSPVTAAAPATCGCGSPVVAAASSSSCACAATTSTSTKSCCSSQTASSQEAKAPVTARQFAAEAFTTGRRLMVMFLGFAFIGYFLNGLIPQAWVAAIFGKGNVYSIPLAATLGLPLYINTEASLPLIRALIDGGMSQGAALAFLITGAGTSFGAIAGALTIARWRVIALVIGTLWVGAVILGYLYNFLLATGLV